jgi:hypothetical protein
VCSDLTKLGDDELLAQLDEHRALLGESIANDYGCETVRGVTIRITAFETELGRRGSATSRDAT